jgi:hypothetical protein
MLGNNLIYEVTIRRMEKHVKKTVAKLYKDEAERQALEGSAARFPLTPITEDNLLDVTFSRSGYTGLIQVKVIVNFPTGRLPSVVNTFAWTLPDTEEVRVMLQTLKNMDVLARQEQMHNPIKLEGIHEYDSFGNRMDSNQTSVRNPVPAQTSTKWKIHHETNEINLKQVYTDQSQFPWKLPTKALAYKCDCKDGFLCREVIYTIDREITPVAGYIADKGPTELAIPLFDYVLHRVHLWVEEIENNWNNEDTRRIVVCPLDDLDNKIQKFYDWEYNAYPSRFISDLLSHLCSPYNATSDPTDERVDLALKWIDAFKSGRANTPCVNAHKCATNGAFIHSYGTNKRLLEFLKGGKSSEDSYSRHMAAAFTLVTYKLCYICYASSDFALYVPELS